MAVINNIRMVSSSSIGRIPLADKAGTFTPSGMKREHKPGRNAADGGFLESPTAAKLDLSVNLLGGIDVTALNNINNETVNVTLADGSVHMMLGASCTEPVGVGDGDTKLTIVANFSEKIS